MLLALPLLLLAPAQSIHCTAQPIPVDPQTPVWISDSLSPFTSTWLSLSKNLAVFPGSPYSGFNRNLVTFERQPDSEEWSARGSITGNGGLSNFAGAFDLEASNLLVSESGYVNAAGIVRGRVISYGWDAAQSQWATPQSIFAPFGGPLNFGSGMARDGEWMAATLGLPHQQLGSPLLLYRRNAVSGIYDYHSRIDQAFTGFQSHVAIHGDLMVAKDGTQLRVFRRDTSEQWIGEGRLQTATLPGFFLRGLRIFGDEILLDARINQGSSSVYTFRLSTSSGLWEPYQDLNATIFPPLHGGGQQRKLRG